MQPRRIILGLIALVGVFGAASSVRASDAELTDERFARLAKGINLSHWLAQVYDSKGYTKAHFDSYVTDADLDLIASLGFTHVRLSIEPKPMMNWADPGQAELDRAYLAHIDEKLDAILQRQLAVIVDIHAHPDFNKRLATDPSHAEALVRFWSMFAKHLSSRDPEMVFLEVLNEPIVDAAVWLPLQERLIATIRASAPRHTIIATGPNWTGLDDLLKVTPVGDRNVVYNFHFYDPGVFTHQGATWGWHTWEHAKGCPYPLTAETIAPLLPKIDNEETRKDLAHQAKKGWDAAQIESEMGRAVAWAKRHGGLRLTCNEFGVYRQFSDDQQRERWIHDVRQACEKLGIGWTMWDYQGGFALVKKEADKPVADPGTVRALGLTTDMSEKGKP